jgi:ATP-binding cassette subfamily F protein 2
MSGRYNEKKAKKEMKAMDKELESGYGAVDTDRLVAQMVRGAASGQGEQELFDKKLTKEEKKVRAKEAREAKKKAKDKKSGKSDDDDDLDEKKEEVVFLDMDQHEEAKKEEMLEKLSQDNIVVTYEAKKGALHANTRDINVSGVTVTFHGKPLIEDTEIIINYGNRYGLIGPNGSGKSTVMKAIAARAIPIPDSLDIYFLDCEYPARGDITALQAVMESNDEINLLEKQAELLNNAIADADQDGQLEIQTQLEGIYARLDQLDASTAEARATTILHGLGFTKSMQAQTTKEFSGGWRMRVALARALFLEPEFLLMDEVS